MKLVLLLLLALCVVSCARYSERGALRQRTQPKKRIDLPKGYMSSRERYSTKPVPPQVEDNGPSSPTDDRVTAHMAIPAGERATSNLSNLIQMGRTLNPEFVKALETLKAFESFKALGEVLESLKAAESSEDPKILKEARKWFNVPKTPSAAESLEALESVLKGRRALAGDNSNLITEHYDTASVIMTECPALADTDAKTVVKSALDTHCYEVLRCLVRHPIWKDRAEEYWYWGMISDTPAFNPDGRVDQLRGKVFKTDSTLYYLKMRDELSLKGLSRDELSEYIIVFDATNILNRFHPNLIRAIAENVNLIIEYGPPRIIDQIIDSIQDLHPGTSHVAPRDVKSAKALHYLFHIGYNRVPKLCLRLNNRIPTVHVGCAKWLTENNCLFLLKEMFQKYPDLDYDHDQLCDSAMYNGSLDVLKWLHAKKEMQCPSEVKVGSAADPENLEIIKWVSAEFGDQLDWKAVINHSRSLKGYSKVIDYIEHSFGVILEPEMILMRLATNGSLTELQAAFAAFAASTDKPKFAWNVVADYAARGGHPDIVKWVYEKSKILPNGFDVEQACMRGNYSFMREIFKIDSTQITPEGQDGSISASNCLAYAFMHNKPQEVVWILNFPLQGVRPSARTIYLDNLSVPEEAYIRAFEWAASRGAVGAEQEMMLDAANRGHVKIFQWLRKRGLTITAEVVKEAAEQIKVEILKAIHAINPSLVCTLEIANLASKNWNRMWKYDVLDWMWKTCGILPDNLSLCDECLKEWVAERRQEQESLPK